MLSFIKREIVLLCVAAAAVVTAFFVPPSLGYIEYIDFGVLALLFTLMLVVAGLRGAGVFELLSRASLRACADTRQLALALVLLCFFSSMLITNDVALLTFVPFTLLVYKSKPHIAMPCVILESVAANLGSMLTPMGNPQNLYLYTRSGMSFGSFAAFMAPLAGAALALILPWLFLVPREGLESGQAGDRVSLNKGKAILWSICFCVCLLAVLKVVSVYIALACAAVAALAADRRLYTKVDYSLLATFVAFIICVGNIGQMSTVAEALKRLVCGNEIIVGAALSQGISNVPATMLLAGFTQDTKALLYGVNIGGLGTLIASMASLIAFRQYALYAPRDKGKFLLRFSVVNFALLALLLPAGIILYTLMT